MNSSPWHIDDQLARLETDSLRAELDLHNPSGGAKISAAGSPISSVTFGQVSMPAARPSELFARGDDLIAIFEERPDYPFRAQIYWRFVRSLFPGADEGLLRPIAGLELILSMQTSLLDSDPALEVATDIAARQASQLTDVAAGRFIEHSVSANPIELSPTSGAGCVKFPLASSELVYVEMIHPADFRRASLTASGTSRSSVRLTHRLFPERLEKGVIVRSRLRAFMAPADRATRAAAAAYRTFAKSEPPLTV